MSKKEEIESGRRMKVRPATEISVVGSVSIGNTGGRGGGGVPIWAAYSFYSLIIHSWDPFQFFVT